MPDNALSSISSQALRRLYLLPFDHRASYVKGMFEWTSPLDAAQTARVIDSKRLIYEGFEAAMRDSSAGRAIPTDVAGILVDEAFGADILRDAKAKGYATAVSTEKSGSDEFEFEYGDDFGDHLLAFSPTYAKALVRYNIDGDSVLNKRQTARLKQLSDFCQAHGLAFMFELLVPPTDVQMADVDGDQSLFDRLLRPMLMRRAMLALQDAGVEPAMWKIEGLDTREDALHIVATAQRDGRDGVACIVLGRGANAEKVGLWLKIAASVPGFTGFAVGRTSFWDPVAGYLSNDLSRVEAVQQIAARFREWVDIFETGDLADGLG